MGRGFNNLMLMSIRNRILMFAVLVTLLPSIGLGWVYFNQTEKALLKSAQQELLGTVTHVRRELDLWFKERYYEIRVFSNSYLVSEVLDKYLALQKKETKQDLSDDAAQLANLESYLSLVFKQFSFYRRLLVFDRSGNVLAQHPVLHGHSAELPDNWQDQLDEKKIVVGEVHQSPQSTPSVLVAVPVISGDGTILGFLAAEIRLDALVNIMIPFLSDEDIRSDSAELLLVRENGEILVSTKERDTAAASRSEVKKLFLRSHQLVEYVNTREVPVVGILTPIPEFSWGIVVEKQQDRLFSVVIKVRNKTLFGVALLVALIGFLAYLISRGIIFPLEKLTEAAAQVANGDLDVNIAVKRRDELGTTTEVFNDMVRQLRQSRERLERLSTTDSLTQLANRKHIMEILTTQLERFRRNNTPFSILLIDADNFKQINDSSGHLVGDELLRHLGRTFDRLLRAVDLAGRYGGEEFLIILDETSEKEALQTAERIRIAIESSRVKIDGTVFSITVSIGVAEIGSGEDGDQLIKRADVALYRAKKEGRNRSVRANPSTQKIALHPTARNVDPP